MRILEMKLSFNPKVFVAVIAVCAAIAAAAAWVTGLNFWILGAIVVAGVLINGLIASIEDTESSRNQE